MRLGIVVATYLVLGSTPLAAQDNMTPAPLVPAKDQLALIESDDPKLARNKKHV